MSGIRIIWKCNTPNSKAVVQLCESLMTKAAQAHGMDTVIIRKEPHDTTRLLGKYVKTVPHITGTIINSEAQTGFALHWNLNSTKTAALPDQPESAPNPEMWKLVHKPGKGFVMADDPTDFDFGPGDDA